MASCPTDNLFFSIPSVIYATRLVLFQEIGRYLGVRANQMALSPLVQQLC